MAQSATVYTFDVELSDLDRGIYESVSVKAARHPSETVEYLITRVIAYCCEYEEGIAFSAGVSTPDEPPLAVRDLTGALMTWIDIGAPDAGRIHKASKTARRVAVYTHKDPEHLRRLWRGERIHNLDAIEVYKIPDSVLVPLSESLGRRNNWTLTVSDRHLTATTADRVAEGLLERVSMDQ